MTARSTLAAVLFTTVAFASLAGAQERTPASVYFRLPINATALLGPSATAARPIDSRRAFAAPLAARGSQQPSGDHARAVQAFQRGVSLADQLQWSDAADAFQEAYRLKPLPSTLRNLGLAHRALGRYTTAVEELQRFLTEANPQPEIRSQVQDIITQMRGELATITIAPSVASAALTLDNRAVHANEDIQVDPGNHVLVGTASGYARTAQTFSVTRTEHRRVELRLESSGGGLFSQWWLWTIVGAVVVGGVVGIVVATSHEAPPDCGSLMVCVSPR